MTRTQPGSTDKHALRFIAEGLIQCDPATGVVLVNGQPRGTDNGAGYNRIYCSGVMLMSHRVMWMYANGPIPAGLVINHRDGNRRNNRLSNLEAITPAQNNHHARRSPNYRGTYPGDRSAVVETYAYPADEDTEWLMQTIAGQEPRHATRIA